MQRMKIKKAWITPTLTPDKIYLDLEVDNPEIFNHHEWTNALNEIHGQFMFRIHVFKRYCIEIEANVELVTEFKDQIRNFIEDVNNQYELNIRLIAKKQAELDTKRAKIKELQKTVNAIDFYSTEKETTIRGGI